MQRTPDNHTRPRDEVHELLELDIPPAPHRGIARAVVLEYTRGITSRDVHSISLRYRDEEP